jgi:hypothetical protein
MNHRENCMGLHPLLKEPKGLVRVGLELSLIILGIN